MVSAGSRSCVFPCSLLSLSHHSFATFHRSLDRLSLQQPRPAPLLIRIAQLSTTGPLFPFSVSHFRSPPPLAFAHAHTAMHYATLLPVLLACSPLVSARFAKQPSHAALAKRDAGTDMHIAAIVSEALTGNPIHKQLLQVVGNASDAPAANAMRLSQDPQQIKAIQSVSCIPLPSVSPVFSFRSDRRDFFVVFRSALLTPDFSAQRQEGRQSCPRQGQRRRCRQEGPGRRRCRQEEGRRRCASCGPSCQRSSRRL